VCLDYSFLIVEFGLFAVFLGFFQQYVCRHFPRLVSRFIRFSVRCLCIIRTMIGIDEVGRGAWAGPLLVVAACLKPGKKLPKGLADSKKLDKRKREDLYPQILEACEIGEGWVSADMIDSLGLSRSLKSATMLAVFQLDVKPDDQIIIDGTVNFLSEASYSNVKTMVKADDKIPIVSAASVVAKVLRDRLMAEYAQDFPGYGFEKHVGYGTKQHSKALAKLGANRLHRQSFKPVSELSDK